MVRYGLELVAEVPAAGLVVAEVGARAEILGMVELDKVAEQTGQLELLRLVVLEELNLILSKVSMAEQAAVPACREEQEQIQYSVLLVGLEVPPGPPYGDSFVTDIGAPGDI